MKRNLIKVIGISFIIFFILSWIIPIGTYSGGELETSSIDPVGLVDFVQTPLSAIVTFALYVVVFATIGGFYGVVEEIGILEKISKRWAVKFEGKESSFLIISITLFSLLSSLTGLIIPLFILVPLFAAAIFKMGYDKITALASTVGGILVGSIGSTYGFNITGYTKNLLSLDMNNQVWARVIIFILLTVALCVTVVMASKKNKKEVKKESEKEVKETKKEEKVSETSKQVNKKAEKENKKSEKKNTKKSKTNTKNLAVVGNVKKVENKKSVSAVPFAIIFIFMIIITFIGMYNWYYSFDIKVFTDFHEALMDIKINKFAIFENLLSGVNQLGYWSNMDFAALVTFTAFVISKVYRLKFSEFIEAYIQGFKKWLPTALYAALANVILVVLYQTLQSGSGNLVETINGTIFGWADGFNPFITGLATFVGSFFFNDLYYLLASMSSIVTDFDAEDVKVAGVLIQSVYSVAMMLFPTSIALIAGLSMFDVKYGNWIKYIWRFVLISLLLVLLVCAIISL